MFDEMWTILSLNFDTGFKENAHTCVHYISWNKIILTRLSRVRYFHDEKHSVMYKILRFFFWLHDYVVITIIITFLICVADYFFKLGAINLYLLTIDIEGMCLVRISSLLIVVEYCLHMLQALSWRPGRFFWEYRKKDYITLNEC